MIEVQGLTRTFRVPGGEVRAVEGLDLTVPSGSFTTLLGPSGCGKTTTLRMVAGLERPDRGVVRIGGTAVFSSDDGLDVPTHRRGVGMVFQSFAVWPHLTVAGNVAYPLRAAKVPRGDIERRVDESLVMVGLSGMASRRTTELSGGQQQRVALARALVARPEVLLLDEPLSNLDARLREEVRGQILDLREALGFTVLFVTHDREEALSMSDEVVVMAGGRALAEGSPQALHADPRSAAVARLLGVPNVLEGTFSRTAGGAQVLTAIGPIAVATTRGGTDRMLEGERCAVTIRRDAIDLLDVDAVVQEDVSTARGVLLRREFRGETTDVLVSIGSTVLRARQRPAGTDRRVGEAVLVAIDAEGCRLVASDE